VRFFDPARPVRAARVGAGVAGAAFADLAADALESLRQAVDCHRTAGDQPQQALTLRLLGYSQARSGMTAESRDSLEQAAVIFEELGDTEQAAHCRVVQGGFS
jgi:hypothetical protein